MRRVRLTSPAFAKVGKGSIYKISPSIALFAKRGLYEHFQTITAKLGWKRKGEVVLLGLSGGRDSVCLLHLLLVSGHHVVAAHLNHCLRGKESMRDERFVKDLCKRWHVPLIMERENIANRAKCHKLSMEEAARIGRYRFLERAARKKKLQKVVVAHHQQDQAETVLLKIFHGCNRNQLSGMKVKGPLPSLNWDGLPFYKKDKRYLQLTRPLLKAPHSEIARYARQNRLIFCQDSSNRDLSHPRNWVRHRLLPLIKRRLNRNVIKTLARLCENSLK